MYTSDYQNLEEVRSRGTSDFPVGFYVGHYVCAGSVLHYHWHKEWQWIYMIDGDAIITVDGRRIKLCKNESVFIDSGQLHIGITDNPTGCKHLSIVFNPEKVYDAPWLLRNACESFSSGRCSLNTLYQNDTPGKRRINDLLRQLYELSQDTAHDNTIIMLSYLHAILGYIIRDHLFTYPLQAPISKESQEVKQILYYIHSHYNEPIGLADLAEHSRMSIQNLCRIFKRETGTTIIEYLNTYRIYEATLLLRRSNMSINDVSNACGFENTSYFIKIFKRLHGITPSVYREQLP